MLLTAVVQTICIRTLGDTICPDISTGVFIFELGFIGKRRNIFKSLSFADLTTPRVRAMILHSRCLFQATLKSAFCFITNSLSCISVAITPGKKTKHIQQSHILSWIRDHLTCINNIRNSILHLLEAHYPARLALQMINESRQSLELFPTGLIETMIKALLVSRRFEVLPQTVEGHIELMA
jgi:hypothetical protein